MHKVSLCIRCRITLPAVLGSRSEKGREVKDRMCGTRAGDWYEGALLEATRNTEEGDGGMSFALSGVSAFVGVHMGYMRAAKT